MKNGMYGEMPIVKIGNFKISQMTDKEGETRIWFDAYEVEGMGEALEIDGEILEENLKTLFNKYF